MGEDATKRKTTRVLITDDSPFARYVIETILRHDADIEVVGHATDGKEVVKKTRDLKPDIITMDLRMPGLDGLAATEEIMRLCPTPVVLVTSSDFAQRRSDIFSALRYGVVDVLEKPDISVPPEKSEAARIFIDKIKLYSKIQLKERPQPASPKVPLKPQPNPLGVPPKAIAIGTSTGGPVALQTVLSGLPADLPVPVFVVQHMSATFMTPFVDWLDSNVPLRVAVAKGGEWPSAGEVLVAPGDKNMVVNPPGVVRLSHPDPRATVIPSVDVLFTSLARTFGAATIGVVLTGIGSDGTLGMRSTKESGAFNLVQDEATCVVGGMPSAALRAGVVDEVLPLRRIADRLRQLVEIESAKG